MFFLTAVLAEVEHIQLPVPTWVYGLVALVIFAALGFVLWSYRDVANRHNAKADAYAAAHGGTASHGGH
jgi:protein-S-isoprenylcysteine O-methyltransferase Ste14